MKENILFNVIVLSVPERERGTLTHAEINLPLLSQP